MNPRIVANPDRPAAWLSQFPYIAPSFGQHAGDWSTEELVRQREQFRLTAPAIPAGAGKHRASRYPNSSYNVVEDGQRDQLKAERLARRVEA